MYKLIAIDLDGTLLNDDKKIPLKNINMIEKLIDKGYEVVIATGRRYWSAKDLIKVINKDMTILANNGNIVRNSENDEVLNAKYMDLEDFRNIMEEGKQRNLYPIIHVDAYEQGYDILIELENENKNYFSFSKDEKRLKQINNYLEIIDYNILAVVYAGFKSELNSFHIDINKKYPNIYNTHVMENITVAEALLEIMNPFGTKWHSLSEYASSKGIKSEEIITIGDDNNDIGMIQNAGLGIAMKNASLSVKAVANIITKKDNNESGVAFELKRVLNI